MLVKVTVMPVLELVEKAKELQGFGKPFYRSCVFPWCHGSDPSLGCWRDTSLRCAGFPVLRKPSLILRESKSKGQTRYQQIHRPPHLDGSIFYTTNRGCDAGRPGTGPSL